MIVTTSLQGYPSGASRKKPCSDCASGRKKCGGGTIARRPLLPGSQGPEGLAGYPLAVYEGWLDSALSTVNSAWDRVTSYLDPNEKVKQQINYVLTTLSNTKGKIDAIRAAGGSVPDVLQRAYDTLFINAKNLIIGLCEADHDWEVRIPADLGLGSIACVRNMDRAEWNAKVSKQTIQVPIDNSGAVNGFGAVFLIPIVIAVCVVAMSAVAYEYLSTAEGRKRMDIAMKSAQTADSILQGVLSGKITAKEGNDMLDKLPGAPPPPGGSFATVGKIVAVIAGLGVGGAVLWHFFGDKAKARFKGTHQIKRQRMKRLSAR
jgi:hypothetical protein